MTIVTVTAPPPLEDRARAIGSQIRCPVCQGESIADSPSETARNMMDLVRDRVAEGRTDQEITGRASRLLHRGGIARSSGIGLDALALAGPGDRTRHRFGNGLASVSGPSQTFWSQARAGTSTLPLGRRRWVLGALFLVLAGAVTVAAVGQNRQARPEDQGWPESPVKVSTPTRSPTRRWRQ